MDWYGTVFEVIDMRSFSNLWFWLALAFLWSSVGHWVLGVPYDMVARARRHGGQAVRDLEDLARIHSGRMLYIAREAGVWLSAIVAAVLTGLALLGFLYGIEFAQALFLLGFPMTGVWLLSLRTAHLILTRDGQGEALYRRLRAHRVVTQMIGMASIFVTAMWGMYQNLVLGPFYG